MSSIDTIKTNIINQMPFNDGEILYKTEINSQIKIYMFQCILGLLMIAVSLMTWYKIK